MTQALVSGSAAVAALLRGDMAQLMRYGEDGCIEIPVADLPYVFRDAKDTAKFNQIELDDVERELKLAWSKDRAVRLLEILLSATSSAELRSESADALEELLLLEEAKEYAEFCAYAIPATSNNRNFDTSYLSQLHSVRRLLSDIAKAQPAVEHLRSAWDNLREDLFESDEARASFELAAITRGAFYRLVHSIMSAGSPDEGLFFCYQMLADQTNHRSIINSWTAGLKSTRARHSIFKSQDTRQEADPDKKADPESVPHRSAHQQFENVKRQLSGVVAQLQAGNVSLARKFAAELVAGQMKESKPGFAVKSLCNLAKQAHGVGQDSLQLEWLEEAVRIDPSDGWAHGQAGDAYLSLFRYEEARREFEAAEHFGDDYFGFIGKARLLKEQGLLDEALQEFQIAKSKFASHEESYRSWAGYAEVLRDLARFDEAAIAYEKAIEQHPDNPVLMCGYASTLIDLGDLDKAADLFTAVGERYRNESYAITGLAEALQLKGDFASAEAVLDGGIREFPSSIILACQRAALRASIGQTAQAKQEYQSIIERFPNEAAGWIGLAECLNASNEIVPALDIYKQAIERFRYDVRARNGYAKALKSSGAFKEALQQFERNIRDFPYDRTSLNGRATLLKELGQYSDAVNAYDELLKKFPAYAAASFGKASALTILGQYEEAKRLLPTRHARTKSEWVGLHIRGMIALKQGNLDEARRVFEIGLHRSPFYEQRKYFSNGQALAMLRLGRFQEAVTYTKAGTDSVARIYRFHAYLALGDELKARAEYRAANDNDLLPHIRALSDGLARKYQLFEYGKVPSDEWIADQEAAILLQAA